jgi:pectate lyase
MKTQRPQHGSATLFDRTVRTSVSLVAFAVIALLAAEVRAQLAAFPSAVGFGAQVTGGRGGRVIHVTTLAGSGTGSLAAAAAATGARIIVFDVSGVITGDVEIPTGNVTIAGQTAPGAGITINGHLYTPFGDRIENIIVRHVRVRPPGPGGDWPPEQHDTILMSDARRVIFDHVDVSHGVDEIVDHYDGASIITWQNSILSFPNPSGGHGDGAHPFCLLNYDGEDSARGGSITVVGNLFAHCRARTPALGTGPAEVINNIVYNGREGFVHHNPARGDFIIAGNFYRAGMSNSLVPFWFDAENTNPPTRYYMGDNYIDDPGVFTGIIENPTVSSFLAEYNILGDNVRASQFYALSAAPTWGAPRVAVPRVSPSVAFENILNCAGAWPRDFVSTTAVTETRNRTGTVRNLALTNLMQGLTAGTAPADGDADGMPDSWETGRGLNPAVADNNTVVDGWPALELYLEERSRAITCPGTTIPTGTGGTSGTTGTGGTGGSGAAGSAGTGVGGTTGGTTARGGAGGTGSTGGRGGASGAAGRGGSTGSTGGAGGRGGATGGSGSTTGTSGTTGSTGAAGATGAAGSIGGTGTGGSTGTGSSGTGGSTGTGSSGAGGSISPVGAAGTGAGSAGSSGESRQVTGGCNTSDSSRFSTAGTLFCLLGLALAAGRRPQRRRARRTS